MSWMTILPTILSSITTFTVAILGWYIAKRNRDNMEYRKARRDLEDEQMRHREERMDITNEKLTHIEKAMNELKNDVLEVKHEVEQLKRIEISTMNTQLSHLHHLQQDSFTYMESLSNVVAKIGTSLADADVISPEHQKGIQDALEKHQNNVSEIRVDLVKVSV